MNGKMVKNPALRARIYSVTAAVLAIALALGVKNLDDIDAAEVADSVVELVAIVSLVMARVNVWLAKPQLPPVPPPPH